METDLFGGCVLHYSEKEGNSHTDIIRKFKIPRSQWGGLLYWHYWPKCRDGTPMYPERIAGVTYKQLHMYKRFKASRGIFRAVIADSPIEAINIHKSYFKEEKK